MVPKADNGGLNVLFLMSERANIRRATGMIFLPELVGAWTIAKLEGVTGVSGNSGRDSVGYGRQQHNR